MSEDELTYGETIKQPFPERDKIEWVMVKAPEWIANEMVRVWHDNKMFIVVPNVKEYNVSKEWAEAITNLHENSKDFKVVWKLK